MAQTVSKGNGNALFMTMGGYKLDSWLYRNTRAVIGYLIIGPDFQIDLQDHVITTAGTAKLEYLAGPMFQYRKLLFFWVSRHGNGSRNFSLLTSLVKPYYLSLSGLTCFKISKKLSISLQRLILNVIAQMTEGENALIVSDQQDGLSAFLKR